MTASACLYTRKDSPYFYIRYYETGGKRSSQKTDFRKDNPIDKKKAKVYLKQVQAKLAEGLQDQIPNFNSISLDAFSKLYTDYISKNRAKKYYISVQSTMKIVKDYFGDVPLKALTTQALDKYINSMNSKYVAVTHYSNLRAFFNKAIAWNYLGENPIVKFKKPKVAVNNPLFIDQNELNKLLETEKNSVYKTIYLFAFHTGCRLGEILNLKWQNIDLVNQIVKVSNTEDFTTKGKRERAIPINDILFPVLHNMLRSSDTNIININTDYLFMINGKKLKGGTVSKHFKDCVKAVKTINPKFHFHDLRHSFASNLVKKGVSLYVVSKLLGHKDITTTQIYAHLNVDSLRDAVKTLEVKSIITGKVDVRN